MTEWASEKILFPILFFLAELLEVFGILTTIVGAVALIFRNRKIIKWGLLLYLIGITLPVLLGGVS